MKPLNDSQHIPSLLNEFPNSKAIWIYRHYQDVTNSAKNRWSNAQRHIISHIAEKDNTWDRWYTEGMKDSDRDLIRSFYEKDISEEKAGILKWYLRNLLYFDNNLKKDSRVLLLNYESFVTKPEKEISKIEAFMQLPPFPKESYKHIFRTSIKKNTPKVLDLRTRKLADEMLERLKNAYQNSDVITQK